MARKMWLYNMPKKEFERDFASQVSGRFSGLPKATEGFTVKALKQLGYVGVYKWIGTDEKEAA